MDRKEEQELAESIQWMREQFQPLNQSIPIPESLRADLLRQRLNELENAQKQDSPKVVRFPWKRVVGVAACMVLVVGSYFLLNPGNQQSDLISKSSAASAMEDSPEAAADLPMPAAFSAEIPEDMPLSADAPMPVDASPRMARGQMEGTAPGGDDAVNDPNLSGRSAMVPENNRELGKCTSDRDPEKVLASLQAACAAETWGKFVPKTLPQGLEYIDGYADSDALQLTLISADYTRELRLYISNITAEQQAFIVDPAELENYDMRYYPIPWSESVPQEKWWVISEVIFRKEQLTRQMIEARIVASNEPQDAKTNGQFSVLFGSTLVQYNFINLSSEELLALIEQVQT